MTPPQDIFQYYSTCPACEGVIDVSTLEPYSKVACPHCGEFVRVRRKFDHFSIIKQIGEGGMSRVFDAEDSTLGRHVALKILNRHYSKDSVRMASFEREAQLTAAVTHPNVVKLYSVGKDQGNFYIAMELVAGGSLEHRITENERLTEAEALRVGRAVAEGLRAAYREGLIHRDVKPANILFTEENTPKIVDFGLALFHARDVDDSGEIWATPFYVAPEKVRDDREDFRSDIYSLGATLYHALTGKPPHKANTNSIQELKVIKSRVVRLEDSGFKFSPRTCELINKTLALRPEDRYASYDELVEAFRDAESLLGYSTIREKSLRQRFILGGASALVAVAIIAVLAKPAPETKVKSIRTNERELTTLGGTSEASTETVADIFLRARGTLLEGKFSEARKLFDGLISSGRAKQPTLNWARFNAALCAMVDGKRQDAEKYFESIRQDAGAGSEMSGVEFKEFFGKIGGRMSQDLGLGMARREVSYEETSEEVLGYLAHGLAQWHFGKPRAAVEWLETFNACAPGRGLEWISSYKKLIAPYIADVQLAKSAGEPRKEPFATVDEARDEVAESRKVLEQLKTNGALRNLFTHRIRFAQEEITRLRRQIEETERKRLDSLRQREVAQLAELSNSLPALVRGYDYSHAVELLQGMKFETPEVQNVIANKIYLWTKAKEFMDVLKTDVASRGYNGTLYRRSGLPLQGRLTRLEFDNAIISLDRGQFTIPTDSLTPETLVAVAQAMVENVSDSTEYYNRLEMIVVFAKMQGLDQMANTVANQLMEENRAFRQRWARVEQSGGN